MLGATSFHNVNNYAIGTFAKNSDAVQYDLNHPNALVGKGDKFGYDYNIKCPSLQNLWTNYAEDFGTFTL